MKNVLILTATIAPKPGEIFLARTDPEVRLKDYEKSLAFYTSLPTNSIDGIIFAENSMHPLNLLMEIVAQSAFKDKFEFIQYDGLDYPRDAGRGYGEFKLVQYVMDHASFVKQADTTTAFWKITGRYMIKNLVDILKNCPETFDIYTNYRNYPRRWLDIYLFGWKQESYRNILNNIYKKLQMNVEGLPKNCTPEEIMRAHLDIWQEYATIVNRYGKTPYIEGVKGVDNRSYEKENYKRYLIRKAINGVCPWLYI